MMACLMAHLYFDSLNEPVFEMVPLAESFLTCSDSAREQAGCFPAPSLKKMKVVKKSVDRTEFDVALVCALRDFLLSTQARLKFEGVRNECLQELIRRDPRLSLRQATVLLRALADKGFSVCLQDFQREYSIAYATARADLLGLVNLGFLVCEKEGRAFRFRPAGDIGNLILENA